MFSNFQRNYITEQSGKPSLSESAFLPPIQITDTTYSLSIHHPKFNTTKSLFMKKIYTKSNLFLAILVFGTFLLSSCGSTQNVVYLSNLDTAAKYQQIPKAAFKQPLILTDDVLSITIQTQDVTDPSAFNQTSSKSSDDGSDSEKKASMSGFLVDGDGNVEIPIIGAVQVAGLTTNQAKELIKAKASKYYKDPTVQVRFANYKITILGEVGKPASYTVPNEKITVFDAISMAGDLTIYGKRENVMLMRDNGDKKDIIRLNLNSSDVIASPYYYLKQNDVLYVEPSKAKVAANDAQKVQLITIAISVVTLLVTILARF
jgi:polysaccharide export outer membrane protein